MPQTQPPRKRYWWQRQPWLRGALYGAATYIVIYWIVFSAGLASGLDVGSPTKFDLLLDAVAPVVSPVVFGSSFGGPSAFLLRLVTSSILGALLGYLWWTRKRRE